MTENNNHKLHPEKWVVNYADYLFNYTITRIENEELAKDLVQETFFSALKAMPDFRGQAAERTWLVSILKRKIIDQYRKMNSAKGKAEVRVNFYQEGDKKGDWIEECIPRTWENEAEKDIENEELKTVLDLCIENLPEKYRYVFLMKTIQQYDTEAMCKELEITASNLWVIIHRARHQLRKCLEANWFAK